MSYDFVNSTQDLISRLHYPQRKDFMTTWWYSEGRVVAKHVGNNVPEFVSVYLKEEKLSIKELNQEYPIFEKKVDEEAYKSANVIYSVEKGTINEGFEIDLARYLGIKRSHPKFNLLMKLSREYAGSSSLQSIVEVAEDLVDLLT